MLPTVLLPRTKRWERGRRHASYTTTTTRERRYIRSMSCARQSVHALVFHSIRAWRHPLFLHAVTYLDT